MGQGVPGTKLRILVGYGQFFRFVSLHIPYFTIIFLPTNLLPKVDTLHCGFKIVTEIVRIQIQVHTQNQTSKQEEYGISCTVPVLTLYSEHS